jgi:hypothetical protein
MPQQTYSQKRKALLKKNGLTYIPHDLSFGDPMAPEHIQHSIVRRSIRRSIGRGLLYCVGFGLLEDGKFMLPGEEGKPYRDPEGRARMSEHQEGLTLHVVSPSMRARLEAFARDYEKAFSVPLPIRTNQE